MGEPFSKTGRRTLWASEDVGSLVEEVRRERGYRNLSPPSYGIGP